MVPVKMVSTTTLVYVMLVLLDIFVKMILMNVKRTLVSMVVPVPILMEATHVLVNWDIQVS